MQVSTLA
jgi:hypothetical protein